MVHVQNSRLQNLSNATVSSRKPLGTGPRATRLRLYSGFFLFSFVFTHYLNHMLGLHSLDLMEAGRELFNVFWRFLPVEILLALSLLAHASLALLKIAQSRSSSLSFWDGAQIFLGVAIPFLIADHIFGTRGLSLRDGLDDTYTWTVWALWPSSALMQSLALFVVWVHGVIGLHFWFRLRSWYSAFLPYMFVIAVLWPVMALLGFASAGKELNLLKAQDGVIDQMLADVGFLGRDAVDWVSSMEQNVMSVAAFMVATVFFGGYILQGLQNKLPDRLFLIPVASTSISLKAFLSLRLVSWLGFLMLQFVVGAGDVPLVECAFLLGAISYHCRMKVS